MSHARKKKGHGGVELNLAAMLDMAFQLLTFFIFTFKPAPVESQIAMRLPAALPVNSTRDAPPPGGQPTENVTKAVETLLINVFGDNSDAGTIKALAIGETNVEGAGLPGKLRSLETRLRSIMSDPASSFEQVIIQVSSNVHYNELMKVVDVCNRQKLASGKPLQRLSFVEVFIPEG